MRRIGATVWGGYVASGTTLQDLLLSKVAATKIVRGLDTIREGLELARAGALLATVILVADDATLVGTLDNVAIPPSLPCSE